MKWIFFGIVLFLLIIEQAHFGWFIGLLAWLYWELQRNKDA